MFFVRAPQRMYCLFIFFEARIFCTHSRGSFEPLATLHCELPSLDFSSVGYILIIQYIPPR